MSESLLRTHIRDLRQALGEGVVETVVGRGYRFLADVKVIDTGVIHAGVTDAEPKLQSSAAVSTAAAQPLSLVGRESELAAITAAVQAARDQRRSVLFVSGEAGVGKTTLVDCFLRWVGEQDVWAARGSSVEQYGSGEPYLPILDALASLCRGRGGEHALALLVRHAPTWVVQMPSSLVGDHLEEVQRRIANTTQAQMLRALAEALEALSRERPVVLALDDLHWSDHSTIDFIGMLARRREPARILVIGTYRAAELAKTHPLTKLVGELVAHKQAASLPLEGFTEGALDEYASARFSAHSFPPELLSTVYRTTGGNPLFVSTLFDDLENRKMVAIVDGVWELSARVSDVAARRPDSIRRLIDIQIDRLGATEQRVLEAASVAGQTFTAGVVAAALGLDVDEVDSCCESLTHDHQGLLYVGRETWPDGTIQSRYAFSHSLYQHAAFARSTAATVRVWHRRIGERLEAGYPERTDDVAAELAQHLDEGHAFAKAAHYYVLAAERAVRRHGNTEALGHFEKAQGLLARLPEGRERDEIELRLVDGLGPCLFTVKALAASNIVTVFERSADLARRIGDDRRLCTALLGLQRCRTLGGALREVGEHTPEVVTLAARLAEPDLVADAIFLSSRGEFLRGRFAEAREGFTRVRALVSQPREVVVSATGLFGLLEWLTGYPDAALRRGRESLELAEALGEPFALAQALCSLAFLHTWRREPAPALKCGQRALNLANDVPLAMWQSRAGAMVHWATSALNPATSELHVDQLLAQPWDAGPLGTALTAPTFIEVCARAGREAMALGRIAPVLAFMEQTDERVVEPEIHRLQGELAKATDPVEAERRFNAAIEIARRQSSRSFELRATLSLCRLLGGAKKRPGRAPERERALEDLRALLDTFTEGQDTGDLVEARALSRGAAP